MEEWVKHSCIFNYADDTESSCKGKDEQVVMKKLEEDATNILQFMASNGLVANPTKTVFMMLKNKKKEKEGNRKITVGDHQIQESKSTKLLGMMIDTEMEKSFLTWTEHGLWIEKVQKFCWRNKICCQ